MICLVLSGPAQAGEKAGFQWDKLPEFPPASGQQNQIGVAGPFSGVHNEALIVAGGANFPGQPSWEGGKKVWWDDIFVLEKTADGKPAKVFTDAYKYNPAMNQWTMIADIAPDGEEPRCVMAWSTTPFLAAICSGFWGWAYISQIGRKALKTFSRRVDVSPCIIL